MSILGCGEHWGPGSTGQGNTLASTSRDVTLKNIINKKAKTNKQANKQSDKPIISNVISANHQ